MNRIVACALVFYVCSGVVSIVSIMFMCSDVEKHVERSLLVSMFVSAFHFFVETVIERLTMLETFECLSTLFDFLLATSVCVGASGLCLRDNVESKLVIAVSCNVVVFVNFLFRIFVITRPPNVTVLNFGPDKYTYEERQDIRAADANLQQAT